MQYLSPYFDLKLLMAFFDRVAESTVAGGGPWRENLVKATAFSILRHSLSVIILLYMLKIPSAGASVKMELAPF